MAVKEGLLALLDEGPRHGYQLKTAFESATGGVWPLNVGQVYTTLDRLERDGLVDVDERDGQKTYKLTLDGVAALGEWWQTVPAEDPPPRDELMLKVLMAIEHGPDHALAVITRQRSALLALLQQRRRERQRAEWRRGSGAQLPGGEGMASSLVADALVVRAEADLRWLDLCESRLTRKAAP
jgi:DNA-binding PadR family transcriptional regulator